MIGENYSLLHQRIVCLDSKKKQGEKREIVMMVMYDMYNSLKSIEKADSVIQQAMEMQLQIAEDTSKFETLRYYFAQLIPKAEYTETTVKSPTYLLMLTPSGDITVEPNLILVWLSKIGSSTLMEMAATIPVRMSPYSNLL